MVIKYIVGTVANVKKINCIGIPHYNTAMGSGSQVYFCVTSKFHYMYQNLDLFCFFETEVLTVNKNICKTMLSQLYIPYK